MIFYFLIKCETTVASNLLNTRLKRYFRAHFKAIRLWRSRTRYYWDSIYRRGPVSHSTWRKRVCACAPDSGSYTRWSLCSNIAYRMVKSTSVVVGRKTRTSPIIPCPRSGPRTEGTRDRNTFGRAHDWPDDWVYHLTHFWKNLFILYEKKSYFYIF